jgi:hypothetical protein
MPVLAFPGARAWRHNGLQIDREKESDVRRG